MPFNNNAFAKPVFREYLEKAASDIGAAVEVLDDDFGYLVRVHWRNRFVNICGESLPLNSSVASRIVKDKWYTQKILRRAGIAVPEGQIFFREGYYRTRDYAQIRGKKEALLYAARLGYPVVVKPNSLSHGREVRLVYEEKAFSGALEAVFRLDHIALVQEPVAGEDIRLILLDQDLFLAYKRNILAIEGDGKKSVGDLIDALNRSLEKRSRGTVDPGDPEILRALKSRGYDTYSIPGKGQQLVLKAFNLNLASGTEAEEVTGEISAEILGMCRTICRELNLRLAGIDLKYADNLPAGPVVLEVNGSPSLKHWYRSGHREQVVGFYRILLERIFEALP
jgi:glutathione synthase/RimK-type ligase-like ATP-grasp enzyme